MEANINDRLQGYSVRIERLDFHPIGLSLDLENFTIYQNAHPEPPVAHFPNLSASVQWKALLHGKLVADFELDDPTLRFDLTQFRQEKRDETPIEERGWQKAIQSIYPLKINRFVIRNGDVTYIDKGDFKPLRLTKVNLLAENILNVVSEKGTYPSPVRLEGTVFESGTIRLDGHADFLAEPHIAVQGNIELAEVALDYFRPIAERYDISMRKGVLSSRAFIEYSPDIFALNIKNLTLDDVAADYIRRATDPAQKIGKKVDQATREYANEPTVEVKVDELRVRKGQLGYIDRGAKPSYRIFFTDTQVDIENFSNHLKDGVARGRANGKFMGTGPSHLEIAFRPENKGPDFNLNLAIEDTDMRAMNELFRAYGNFDVVAGVFSFYSEIRVRRGRIDGYVKPLFKNVDVYDQRQDREKNIFRKMYEGLVGGLSSLLENDPREEVATQTSVSGKIESPETSTWETLLRLVQNAFFKAILPGFEKEVSQQRGRRTPASQ